MNHGRNRAIFGIAVLLTAIGCGVVGRSNPQDASVEVRKTEEQVVLYTVHRGSFDTVSATISGLIGTAIKKGVYPRGAISFAYLTDFGATPPEHWLTEIRVPVGTKGLSLAGTLGKFTDVKRVPSMEVAAVNKPEGDPDPEPALRMLYDWMFANGYMPTTGPCEVFLSHASSGDYSKMKSEIRIPVRRMAPAQ